jgi:hypothetical protein
VPHDVEGSRTARGVSLVLPVAAALLAGGVTFARFDDLGGLESIALVQAASAVAALIVGFWAQLDAVPARRLPVALALVLTLLPWTVGLAMGHLSREAIDFAYHDDARVEVLRTLGRSLLPEIAGVWISAALSAALGLALAISAPRSKTRWWMGAAAAPVLLATALGYEALDSLVAHGSLVVAGAIGVAAVRPSHHSFAGALGLAIGLALAAHALATEDALSARESPLYIHDDEVIRELGAIAARWNARDTAHLALFFGTCAGLALAIAGALDRVDRRPTSIARAVAAFAALVLIATSTRLVSTGRAQRVEAAVRVPWANEAGFEPTTHGRSFSVERPVALVTLDHIAPAGEGRAVPIEAAHDDPERVRAFLRRFYEQGRTHETAYEEWLATRPASMRYDPAAAAEYNMSGVWFVSPTRLRVLREIPLAVDRRLPIATFRALLRAIADAGFDRVVLAGFPAPAGSSRDRRAIGEQPFLAAIIAPDCSGGSRVFLERAVLPEPVPDQILFDGTVDARELELTRRSGGRELRADGRRIHTLVFLTIGEDATMDRVIAALEIVHQRDQHAVLIAD